ncbi:hypothetical protein OH77DRAFT_1253526 [Trametes cingulata]|nr:hypothetical protein OH77DRAFT_1253526 [Trametes cingulata]
MPCDIRPSPCQRRSLSSSMSSLLLQRQKCGLCLCSMSRQSAPTLGNPFQPQPLFSPSRAGHPCPFVASVVDAGPTEAYAHFLLTPLSPSATETNVDIPVVTYNFRGPHLGERMAVAHWWGWRTAGVPPSCLRRVGESILRSVLRVPHFAL